MAEPTSPVIKGWELGVRLREYREQAGLTATASAKLAGVTQGHVSAVELGRPKLTADRLRQFCEIYDINEPDAAELEALRSGATERAWWHEYSGIFSAELQRFLGLEAGAEQIRVYHSELIPGLLQTEDYTRALISGGTPHVRLTEVERRVAARMLRQSRLDGQSALQVSAVLSEGALRQHIGTAATMRRQLEHLAAMAERPNIDIQILPFATGVHPSIGAPYQILSFASARLHDIVWQEILTSTKIVDRLDEVTEYAMTFHETARLALNRVDSIRFIRDAAKEF